jgi:opacity protein-like surface antigen
MLKKCAVMAALLLALSPAAAHADWLFTPNLGTTFSSSTNTNEHFTYGASIGWMGAGIFGWEADLSYTPEFFKGDDSSFSFVDSSNVVSVMGNALIGIPIGGQRGGGFRPYFAAGMGLLSREVQSTNDLFDVNTHDWGFNLGAGAMGFFTDHVGVRGDIRYLRSFKDLADNFDAGAFHYWRGTAGVTFRW